MTPEYFRVNYLDASAAVRLVLPEPGYENIRKYFSERGGFHITNLCFAEALGVLKCKWRHGELSDHQYLGCCYLLIAYCSHPARIHLEETGIENRSTFFKAVEIARKHKLDLSDALQLLTVKYGRFCKLTGPSKTVLVTADSDLAAAAKAEGLEAWNCGSELTLPPQ